MTICYINIEITFNIQLQKHILMMKQLITRAIQLFHLLKKMLTLMSRKHKGERKKMFLLMITLLFDSNSTSLLYFPM